MLAVGLVEVAVLVGEGEGRGPEIARGGVLHQAPAKGIRLADVSQFAAALRIWPQQHIHPGTLGLRPGTELRKLGAGHHKTDAAPIALLHDAHPLRQAGGNEHAESEGARGSHAVCRFTAA